MLVRIVCVVIAMVAVGCAKSIQPAAAAAPTDERYRPSWTLNVGVHLLGAAACLDGREEPRFVAHVEPLATGAVGFTTVDAYGAVQNCAYADGKVLRREQAAVRGTDLVGLPLFSVGPVQPVLPVGVKLEEVLDGEDHIVGWLFWPAASGRPGAEQ